MSKTWQSATELVDALISTVGKTIVLGLPIGVGKAVHVVDALFERAVRDPSVSLTIFTGLTLSVPQGKNEFESRFIGPLAERLYADWKTPAYDRAMAEKSSPPNIRVREFYLRPVGKNLGALPWTVAAPRNVCRTAFSTRALPCQ